MSGSNERDDRGRRGGELGRATAGKLAAAGFTVAGVDRSEEGLKELPDGIWRKAADPAAARSVVDRIAAEAGPPEVLVNTSMSAAASPRCVSRSWARPRLVTVTGWALTAARAFFPCPELT